MPILQSADFSTNLLLQQGFSAAETPDEILR